MKKIKNIWIYSLVVIGFALIISNSCKDDNSTDPPTSQVPVFNVTADSVMLQGGGEGYNSLGNAPTKM